MRLQEGAHAGVKYGTAGFMGCTLLLTDLTQQRHLGAKWGRLGTQVGAGGIKPLAAAKAPMSMGEILEMLVSKARLEAEDAQRVLLGALNGLAALMLLESGPTQTVMAITTYRQVCCAVIVYAYVSGPRAR